MPQKRRNTGFRCRLVRGRIESLELRTVLSSVGWDGPGRGSAELTYYIGDTPSYLDSSLVEGAIDQALAEWADVIDVRFTRTLSPGQPDSIDFSFAPIDGPGGTLAQAYLPDDVNSPRIAGDVQFDTSERWEIGDVQASAFDLVLVAVHEIGHALGLDHSLHEDAVMAAYASPTQSYRGLSPSDRAAAVAIYAPAAPPETEPGLDPASPGPDGPPDGPATNVNPAGPPDVPRPRPSDPAPPHIPWDTPANDPLDPPDPPAPPAEDPWNTPADPPHDDSLDDPPQPPERPRDAPSDDPWDPPSPEPWDGPVAHPWWPTWRFEVPFVWFPSLGDFGLGFAFRWLATWMRIGW